MQQMTRHQFALCVERMLTEKMQGRFGLTCFRCRMADWEDMAVMIEQLGTGPLVLAYVVTAHEGPTDEPTFKMGYTTKKLTQEHADRIVLHAMGHIAKSMIWKS